MNTVGKVLVVFVTATSLGFLAFVAAMRNGGSDWLGEMRSPELQKEFVFTTEPGEKVTYSAKHRLTESNVAEKTPVMAEVVVKARKRLEEEATKKFQALSPQPQQLEDVLKSIKELIPVDRAAVELREKNLTERNQTTWTDIQTIGAEFSATTVQAQEIMRVGEERRGEVYRLMNQLELLRNDKFSAEEQQRFLEDERIRLEINKARLERRQNQLKQQLSDGY